MSSPAALRACEAHRVTLMQPRTPVTRSIRFCLTAFICSAAACADSCSPGEIRCDASGVCAGTLDPSSLDEHTESVPTGFDGTGAAGMHWFCRPEARARWNGRVVLHLIGTWSDPASDHLFPEHACALGFAAIVPMYENRDPAREACGEDGDCYEAHRREVVDGVDGAPAPVDVDVPNSVRGRVATLLARLAEDDDLWATIRDQIAERDWSNVVLSGHSQGSGHALYLAREEAAERLVLLAGPSDRLGDGTEHDAPVPWIDGLRTTPLRTARASVFSYIHEDDTVQIVDQVLDNWDAIGVADTTCTYEVSGGYPPSCRRILIPSDDCPGLRAHAVVVKRRWGQRCFPGFGGRTNEATWEHFLRASDRARKRIAPRRGSF